MPTRKPHYVEVSMTSVSNDEINSETIHREYSGTPDELVTKNFAFAEGVIAAVIAKARELAAPFLRSK